MNNITSSEQANDKFFTIEQKLLPVGYGNNVAINRVLAIISPHSAPAKKLRSNAKKNGMLIDTTQGRSTKSMLILDTNHIILSSMHVETMSNRYENVNKKYTNEPFESLE